jgi:tetratricopeptide (TPR) repeat protein
LTRISLRLVAPLLFTACLCIESGGEARAQSSLQSVREAFHEANARFAAGRFEQSAEEFRSILDQGWISAALLYDLANAESRAGRPGWAVLYYQRALALAPRDDDIRANLRQTREGADLLSPQRGRWDELARSATIDEWSALALAALWIAAGICAIRALRPSAPTSLPISGRVCVSLLCLATICFASLAYERVQQMDRAIVVDPAPALRSAPFDEATTSTQLAPGDEVALERTHGGFALIRTDEGEAGWVPAPLVARIAPD